MQVRPATRDLSRNYLKGSDCANANAVLAAAGYNIRLLLRWLEAALLQHKTA